MPIRSKPPAKLAPYLTTDGSLTALLEAHAKRHLTVQLVSEELLPMTHTQKHALALPTHRPTLAKVRTSLLYGSGDTPWVHAVSVFPLASLVGDAKRLGHLGTTPIGYVLFKKNRTLPHRRLIYQDLSHQQDAWVRQTVYEWRGRSLMVSEWFLEAFVQTL